jgi:hypothetical protein
MRAPKKNHWKIVLLLVGLFGRELGKEHLVLLLEFLLGHEFWLSSFVAEAVTARGFLETLQQSFETLAGAASRAVLIDKLLDLVYHLVKVFLAQVSSVATGVFHMNEFSLGSSALKELVDDGQA